LCQSTGHKAGQDGCPSVTPTPQDGITTIFGSQNPLSNHYPCTVKVMGHSFASAEHAYLHTKALNSTRPEIAQNIKDAKSASEAKLISKEIPFNPVWLNRREEMMETILNAKVQQVPAFKDALIASGDDILVGAAPGDFDWGSGLSARHTKTTLQNRWPGRNLLGKMQMKLREETKKRKTKKNTEADKKVHNTRSQSQQQPPEEIRIEETGDSGSGKGAPEVE